MRLGRIEYNGKHVIRTTKASWGEPAPDPERRGDEADPMSVRREVPMTRDRAGGTWARLKGFVKTGWDALTR